MMTRLLNLRKTLRKRMRHAAWIRAGENPAPVPCVLWDRSEHGARLTAAHSNLLPDLFTLMLSRDGTDHRYCQVMWRKPPHIGVRFLDKEEAEELSRSFRQHKNPGLDGYRKL